MAEASLKSPQERFELITRGLQETTGANVILDILTKNERPLKLYWGTAPTGRPHIAYIVPLTKIADFLRAGVEVKVLVADIHAMMDSNKSPEDLVKARAVYYKMLIVSTLKSIGVPTERLIFVLGSDFQLDRPYVMDEHRMRAIVNDHEARRAGTDVVKQDQHSKLSSLSYPGMQALDEQHLGVDVQFGGVDQRGIFMLAEEKLPKLGMPKRAHLMNAMVPGLTGAKMSASDPDSKIDMLDSPKDVKRKLNNAACVEGIVEGNGVLAFLQKVLLPIARLRTESEADGVRLAELPGISKHFCAEDAPAETVFSFQRPEKYGGNLHYTDYESIEADFAAKKLHPLDLKNGVADAINIVLEPIRREFDGNAEFREAERAGYPSGAKAKPAQQKKEKKVNPRHLPGGIQAAQEAAAAAKAQAQAQADGVTGTAGSALATPAASQQNTTQKETEVAVEVAKAEAGMGALGV